MSILSQSVYFLNNNNSIFKLYLLGEFYNLYYLFPCLKIMTLGVQGSFLNMLLCLIW